MKDKIIIYLYIIFLKHNIIQNKVKESYNLFLFIINENELNDFVKFNIVKTIYEIYKNSN